MSKSKIKIKKEDVKFRKTWGQISPATKIFESKKKYSRKLKHQIDFLKDFLGE